MSTKSIHREDGGKGKIIKEEYLRKLKTMKKKYFVLRGESTEASARIEYYDNEKKYRSGQTPKRTISLKMCFNINKRTDTKHKHVIALYTRDEVFSIVMENEKQHEDWLRQLLIHQSGGEDIADGEEVKPTFEHVWEVKLQDKGLGDSKSLVGAYYVCLSDQTLSLVKAGSEPKQNVLEFPLTQIRRCGDTESFFYIEVGRHSVIGAGELWMLTGDSNIAKSMNAVILRAFTNHQREANPDPHRKRSSSATEMNRPPGMLQRRQTHGANSKIMSTYSGCTWNSAVPVTFGGPVVSITAPTPEVSHKNGSTGTRERSDSMPSRNRTTSEGTHKALIRPASVHLRGVSYSPPGVLGPASIDSAGSSLSIDEPDGDRGNQVTSPDDHTIFEENVDDALQWPHDPDLEAEKLDRYHPMRPPASLSLPIHQRKISTSSTVHGSPCESSPVSDYLTMSPVDSNRGGVPSGSSPSYVSDYLTMSPSDSRNRRDITSGSSPGNPSEFTTSRQSPGDVRRFSSMTTGSPSTHSDYLLMNSPSDGRVRGHSASVDYLPMCPADISQRGTRSHGHSRESSLAEEAYVPMAPAHSDDGYVDMDPVNCSRFLHDDHHSDMSPGSSCSIISGTPSSDHYMLEKVPSFFTPSEEEEGSTGQPARHYSFGSQPKGRIDVRNAAEAARVRAFSMGNQQRPTTHKLSTRPTTSGKYPSAPLLSSSWSGTSRQTVKETARSDFMEMDFTKNAKYRNKNLPMDNLGSHGTSSTDSGYMDMSSKSPPKPLSSKLFSPPDSKGVLSRKTAVISSSTLKTIGEKPDIKPQKFPTTSSANLNILPNKHQAPNLPYMEMKPRLSSTGSDTHSEGYMNMSFGSNSGKSMRKGSTDSMGDYLPMQGGAKRASDASADYMPMGCGKRQSQPIAIASSSPMVRASPSTPPKHPTSLPLETSSTSFGLLSSMRRNTKRKSRKKTERRGSKENVTTPTAMFSLSLNPSPQSPKESAPESDLAAPLSRVLRICSKENSPALAESTSPDTGDYAVMRPGASTTQRWTPPNASRPPPSPLLPLEAEPAPQSRDSFETSRLQAAAPTSDASAEVHPGVSRQVSTSSSSSTEVMSVKEVSVLSAGGGTTITTGAGPGNRERDITYASLDLGSEGEEPRSPRPSPAPSPAPATPFSYAEIDFQSLRTSAQSFSRQIRH